jgi:hypothetical protein
MSEKIPKGAMDFFRKAGAKGGKIGGKRRMQTLTAAQRSEIASKAGSASAKARKKAKANQKLK